MGILADMAKITANQRLIVVSAISAMLLGLTQFPDPPQAAPAPAGQQQEAPIAAVQMPMPKGYAQPYIVRDPFAMPAQFQPLQAGDVQVGGNRDQQPAKAAVSKPVVHGIVRSGATKIAILSTGAESRSYRMSEKVGSYVITAISDSSVTLQGPDGSVVVLLGR